MQSPLPVRNSSGDDASVSPRSGVPANRRLHNPMRAAFERWLNRGLGLDRGIELRIAWPLWLILLLFFNQLLAPHPVWVVLLISLCGFYVVGYLWVRSQTPAISLRRTRIGSILVAGDLLQEEFELKNESPLPLLWGEFVDHSNVPDYHVGRIVACEGNNFYRWRTEILCKRRGLYKLGPHKLRMQDPLGIFSVTITNSHEEVVVIYPRVVQLPPMQMPRGNSQGGDRQRRPILGNLPAATISEYQQGDSLRNVHWVSTARRGRLMVKELEIEPSGNLWIIADLDQQVQSGAGDSSTLEQVVLVTASIAAEMLSGRSHRSVGLMAYSNGIQSENSGLIEVLPGIGSAHLWPILSALAPVSEGDLRLGTLLSSRRERIGRGSTLIVVTPLSSGLNPEQSSGEQLSSVAWIAELVHLKGVGVDSSVVLIGSSDVDGGQNVAMQSLLAKMGIPSTIVSASASLPVMLTFRRRRRVVRTTPTGGAISYEVDEEVG